MHAMKAMHERLHFCFASPTFQDYDVKEVEAEQLLASGLITLPFAGHVA
jgi:hypothetical protein